MFPLFLGDCPDLSVRGETLTFSPLSQSRHPILWLGPSFQPSSFYCSPEGPSWWFPSPPAGAFGVLPGLQHQPGLRKVLGFWKQQ